MGRTLLFQRTREVITRTPMELLMERRLERAAELLAAGEGNVGEVAYAVGFRSVSHFTNRFRERFRVTPSAWRRRAGRQPASIPQRLNPPGRSDKVAADAHAHGLPRRACILPPSRHLLFVSNSE